MSDLLLTLPVAVADEDPGPGETAAELALTTNIYAEIRRRLELRGVPPDQVAFIHDAKTPEQRAALFAAVNAGQVRILIGSTEKMGTGMNAQERLLAVHQITPPWRPGDIEQQVGRMLRQGNRYPQVFQFVYVTEGSFDGYTWQLLENKAGFIDQIARGAVSAREVDDVAENVLTFSEIKALASGDPKILQKVVLDSELARLAAIRSAWQAAQKQAAWSLDSLRCRLGELEKTAAAFETAARTRDAHTPAKFSIQLRRSAYDDDLELFTERDAAGKRIRSLAAGAAVRILAERLHLLEIGQHRGFPLKAAVSRSTTGEPLPQVYCQVESYLLQVNVGESDAGILLSLDARLRSFEEQARTAREEIAVTQAKIASLETELARPWEHEARFTALHAQVEGLAAELDAGAVPAHGPQEGAESALTRADDPFAEAHQALAAIRELHCDPQVLARFGLAPGDLPLEISPEGLKNLEAEIQEKQALLAFGQAVLQAIPKGETVQLDLFGGFAAVSPTRRRRGGKGRM